VGGVVAFRDISAWKQATRALALSLKEVEDLKYAVDQTMIVSVCDREGTVTYVNDTFCQVSATPESRSSARTTGSSTPAITQRYSSRPLDTVRAVRYGGSDSQSDQGR